MPTQGGFLISRIKHLQARIFERLLKARGVEQFNGAQGRILYVLWQQDGQPIRALAQRTQLSPSALTSMLDRMQQQGLILRQADKADRRQIRIRLTEAARALNQAYDEVSGQMNALFYEGFSQGEIARFEAQLTRILDNLQRMEEGSHG